MTSATIIATLVVWLVGVGVGYGWHWQVKPRVRDRRRRMTCPSCGYFTVSEEQEEVRYL